MPPQRLSALDASFLAVESPSAHMHVGWAATFAAPEHGPRPGFGELFAHIAARLGRAPRYRQRIAPDALGLNAPLWIDAEDFDPAQHIHQSAADDLEEGLTAAASVGDDRIQEQATGRISPETFTHGTAEQRASWFKRGFDGGDASSCDTFSGDI